MAKRKRNSNEPVDVGLGATLAMLKNEEHVQPPAVNEDSENGWTTVGAPKKKRKQREQRVHERELQIIPSPDANGSAKPANQLNERNDGPPNHPINPFSTSTHSPTDHNSRSINPFATKKEGGSEGFHASPESSPQVEDEADEQKQREKEERGRKRKLERHYPVIEHSHHARIQSHIKITDLQMLALYILADGNAPQWVAVQNRNEIRQVVVLMVPGLEMDMFNGKVALELPSSPDAPHNGQVDEATDQPTPSNESGHRPKRLRISSDDMYPATLKPERLPEALKPLADVFPHVWPIKAVGEHRSNQFYRVHSPIHTMLSAQIPKSREEKQMKKNHKGPLPQNSRHWENKRTPITKYIATLVEQQENEYVVHPVWFTTPEAKEAAYQRRKAAQQTSEDGWVDTNIASLEDGDVPEKDIEKGSVTAGRQVYTVDCEMCKSEDDKFVLTRVSLLDWDGNVVLDELVKPDVPIKDYLTQYVLPCELDTNSANKNFRYSGITPTMLENVTTKLSDIQHKLLEILTARTILLGHSLNSDLNALQLTHPFLVDSGILYPHVRGPPYKQSLKFLATKYLSKEIQKGGKGHDSVEDALACLNLVKQKCERGPGWGTADTNAESIFKRLGRTTRPRAGVSRAGAVIDWGDPTRGHGGQAQVAIGCKSDQEVAEGIDLALKGHAIGKDGTTQTVDFIWARFRELELVRRWWDHAKTADVDEIRQSALERLGQNGEDEDVDVKGAELGDAVAKTVAHIVQVYESLPRGTAFIVYSGCSDPREVRRLQTMRQQYQQEYQTKNWDNLSVKWTDTEVQALSRACQRQRDGIGFVVVK
jgi:RNA exonuclease 1